MRKQDCCAGIALHTSCYVLGRLAHNNVEVVMTYHQNHLISEMQNGDREDQEIRYPAFNAASPCVVLIEPEGSAGRYQTCT